MDGDKRRAQVGRLEVVERGRRRRWSEDEKVKIILESLQVPRQVTATARRYGISRSDGDGRFTRAEGCHRATNGLRTSKGGPGLEGDAWSIGRLWTYVRDDRPFARPDPPAAVFFIHLIAAGSIRSSIWRAMPD
jgi:hypothetical protein